MSNPTLLLIPEESYNPHVAVLSLQLMRGHFSVASSGLVPIILCTYQHGELFRPSHRIMGMHSPLLFQMDCTRTFLIRHSRALWQAGNECPDVVGNGDDGGGNSNYSTHIVIKTLPPFNCALRIICATLFRILLHNDHNLYGPNTDKWV